MPFSHSSISVGCNGLKITTTLMHSYLYTLCVVKTKPPKLRGFKMGEAPCSKQSNTKESLEYEKVLVLYGLMYATYQNTYLQFQILQIQYIALVAYIA